MGDFSLNYSNNAGAMIFFSYGNQLIDFKPFVDSFSYSFANTTDSDTNAIIYTTTPTVKAFKESKFNVAFNVLAFDVAEAIENHKKFQRLVRMVTPAGNEDITVAKYLFVKFSNLISSEGQKGRNSMDASLMRSEGFEGIISSINYEPEMELGFFEFNGLIFAKSFKITFDLTAVPNSNKSNIPIFRSGLGYGRKYAAFATPERLPFVGPPAPTGGGDTTGSGGDVGNPDADLPDD